MSGHPGELRAVDEQECPVCGRYEREHDEPMFGHPYSCCWSCMKPEFIGPHTFIVCFECGHVYTKASLRRAYRREAWTMVRNPIDAPVGLPRNRWWQNVRLIVRSWVVPAKRIYFCQECVHDF